MPGRVPPPAAFAPLPRLPARPPVLVGPPPGGGRGPPGRPARVGVPLEGGVPMCGKVFLSRAKAGATAAVAAGARSPLLDPAEPRGFPMEGRKAASPLAAGAAAAFGSPTEGPAAPRFARRPPIGAGWNSRAHQAAAARSASRKSVGGQGQYQTCPAFLLPMPRSADIPDARGSQLTEPLLAAPESPVNHEREASGFVAVAALGLLALAAFGSFLGAADSHDGISSSSSSSSDGGLGMTSSTTPSSPTVAAKAGTGAAAAPADLPASTELRLSI